MGYNKGVFMKKLLIFFAFVIAFFAGAIGLRLWQVQTVPQYGDYSGQELFDKVNTYRVSKGLSELQLDPKICDNLVERYLAVKNPDSGHAGFKEWLAKEKIKEEGNYSLVGELYITTSQSTDTALEFWTSSPGHRLTLEMAEMTNGCAYAAKGTGVVVMGEKLPEAGANIEKK
jgi:uncharacterized protein YkwD